jgi:CRISPR-associated protein (TIGR03986 family)
MSSGKFINPYNFVQPDKNVLRKNFVNFNCFHSGYYSGTLNISIKSVDNIPIFIPDSHDKKYWIILDEHIKFDKNKINLPEDLGKAYYYKINKGENELIRCDKLPDIYNLKDYNTQNELLNALKKRTGWIKGQLKEVYDTADRKNKIKVIETDNPGEYADQAHVMMKFCKDPEGNPILPSTSIKGLIRNMAEIISNSCFSNIEGGRLGKRGIPGRRGYRPLKRGGIIKEIPTKEKDGQLEERNIVEVSHKLLQKKGLEKFKNNPEQSGAKVFVSINNRNQVVDISLNQSRQCNQSGMIKTSGKFPGGRGKRHERVFIENGKKIYKIPFQVYRDYLTANKNAQHKKAQSLPEGSLVWFDSSGDTVSSIGFTQVHRKAFSFSIEDKIKSISSALVPCNDINFLCPICNMFGSTDLVKRENEKKKNIAISGKVYFGTGRLIKSSEELEKQSPLKILSSPKPSCTYFYLLAGDYNKPDSRVRGRKLYYHHNSNQLQYTRVKGDSKGDVIIDNQNVSIEALRNYEFKSTIDFVNLSEYELGLLIFSLYLRNKREEKVFHKLGMGKPLGLGTVKIDINQEKSFIINRKNRYTHFLNTNNEVETGKENIKWSDFIKVYQHKQFNLYNEGKKNNEKASDFYSIPYISDLFNILEVNSVEDGFPQIKYPRKTINNEPRGFEWFMQEQQKKHPPQDLPLPSRVRQKNKNLNEWS